MGICIVGIITTARGRLIIDDEKIYTTGTFRNSLIHFDEVIGFQPDQHGNTVLLPRDKGARKLTISKYLQGYDDIVSWVHEQFADIHAEQLQEEQDDLLQNDLLGESAEERMGTFNKAKRWTFLLNWTGGLIGAWTLFYPHPYEVAVCASAVVPLAILLVGIWSKGLVSLRDDDSGSAYKSIYPDATIGLMVPAFALLVRAWAYNLYEFRNIWLPALVVAAVVVGLLLYGNRLYAFSRKNGKATVVTSCAVLLGYSYGIVVIYNCHFDKSQPSVYHSTVLKKRESGGKHTSYYLDLNPWGPRKDTEEVDVSKRLYKEVSAGQQVSVYFYKGALNVPWFYATD
jgi:hypothetical protein